MYLYNDHELAIDACSQIDHCLADSNPLTAGASRSAKSLTSSRPKIPSYSRRSFFHADLASASFCMPFRVRKTVVILPCFSTWTHLLEIHLLINLVT